MKKILLLILLLIATTVNAKEKYPRFKEISEKQFGKWFEDITHIIYKQQFVCWKEKDFRKAINYLITNNTGSLSRMTSNSTCYYFKGRGFAKIAKYSKDKRLVLLEFSKPWDNIHIYHGWINVEALNSIEDYNKSLY